MSQPHRQWPQPIPTLYDGYRFRSKNEARWAAFYKKLGVPYRYEADRYPVNGSTYLIDFEFQEQEEKGITDCLVEIKPKEPTVEERSKAEWLAQTRGIPVYIFYGDQRCPSEKNGAQGILYKVRNAWLVYEGQRLPLALPISNEIRIALLKPYEAGFTFQCIYQHQFPSTLLVGPRSGSSQFFTPQRMLNLMHDLKEVEGELLEVVEEMVKRFLREQPWCERQIERHEYLTCGVWNDKVEERDEQGNCLLEICRSARQLRDMLNGRQQQEKPCSFLIEFDESCSPEPHYWAQCSDCKAVGIFPSSLKHDMFCSLYCRDSEYWPLEAVTFATEEEYWITNRSLVDVEAKVVKEAYSAAREEPFNKKTR